MSAINPSSIAQYQKHLETTGLSPATIARKKASLGKFHTWAVSEGYSEPQQEQTYMIVPEESKIGRSPKIGAYIVISLVGLTILGAVIALNRESQVFRLLTSRAAPEPTPSTLEPPLPQRQDSLSPESSPSAQAFPTPATQPSGTPLAVNGSGAFVLASENPSLVATSGTFKIEGEAISLVTSPFSSGDITVAPDGEGQLFVRSTTSNANSVDIRNANLVTGALIYGNVGNANLGYDFLRFTNGPGEKLHFSVDASGNTYIGGNATIEDKLLVDEIKTKDNSVIQIDNPITFLDAGTIKTTSGNLNLQPSGIINIPVAISNLGTSNVGKVQVSDDFQVFGSTFISGGLDVNGRAIFNDQLELGRFTSNPSAIGQGSLVFNTGDTSVYVWTGSAWVALGGGSVSGFWQRNSGAISPTNITDDVLVGGIATASALFQVVGTGLQRGQVVGTNTTDATAAYVTFTNLGSGNSLVINDASSDSTPFVIDSSGNIGIGDGSPDAKLEILQTSEQLRLTHTDDTVDSRFTVDSSGNLTINNTGTKTVITDDLQIDGADILDSNGNEFLRFSAAASAINEITIANAAASGGVTVSATGGDTNIALSIDAKAGGALNLNNTATGDVLLAGGASATGCTVTNSTGDLTCTGNITGGSSGSQGFWQRNSGALSPTNITDDVLVGGIATASALFQVVGTGLQRGQVVGTNTTDATAAYVTFTNLGSGNSLVINDAASDSTPFVIDASGSVGIGSSTPSNPLQVLSTSAPQLRVSYDASNYVTLGVSSAGVTTLTSTGTSATLDLQSDGTPDVNVAGGSGATGCTVDNATGDLVCTGSITGSGSSQGFWQRNSGALSPTNITDDVLVGGIATASALFQVVGTGLQRGQVVGTNTTDATAAYVTFTNLGSGNSLVINDAAGDTTPFVIDASGNVGVGDAAPAATFVVGDGDLFRVAGASGSVTIDNVGNTGSVTVEGTVLDINSLDFVDAGSVTSGGSAALTLDSASGSLTLGAGTNTLINTDTDTAITINPNGTGAINFHGSSYLLDSSGNLTVQKFIDFANSSYYVDPADGTTSVSLLGGSQILFSTTGKIATTSDNNLTLNAGAGTVIIGTGTGKVDAGTIDPPYTINGLKFATYLPAMTGVKEETTGTVRTTDYISGVGYRTTLDFADAAVGSDLWLFSKVTDLRRNIDKLIVLLSSASSSRTWYTIDPTSFTVNIYSSRPTTISYRLTAPRFDSERWSNTRSEDQSTGFIINDGSELAVMSSGEVIGGESGLTQPHFELTPGESQIYRIVTETGEIIEDALVLSDLLVANLRAGAVDAQRLISPVAEIEEIHTNTISPLSQQSSGVAVKLGEAQTFGILNQQTGAPVTTFDNQGNATFSGTVVSDSFTTNDASVSGTLYADRIVASFGNLDDRLGGLEASISGLAVPDLTATAVENLSVQNNFSVLGATVLSTTSIAGSLLVDGAIQLSQHGIDVLTDTLYVLKSRVASLDIMDGLLRILPTGKIIANADIEIGGSISPLPGGDLALDLASGEASSSGFGKLLVHGVNSEVIASVDATGNASFAGEVSAKKLVIADDQTSIAGQEQAINSNATVGTGTLAAGQLETTISTNTVTSESYIYITPISSTNNYVLYVKSKTAGSGFIVGVDTPIPTDVQFNWWVIN